MRYPLYLTLVVLVAGTLACKPAKKPYGGIVYISDLSCTIIQSDENKNRFNDCIQAAAKAYKVSASLIKAEIEAESGFNSTASMTRPHPSYGLMLLTPEEEHECGNLSIHSLVDEAAQISCGTLWLARQLYTFNGNSEMALWARVAGPIHAKSMARNPSLFPEAREYAKRILEREAFWRASFAQPN